MERVESSHKIISDNRSKDARRSQDVGRNTMNLEDSPNSACPYTRSEDLSRDASISADRSKKTHADLMTWVELLLFRILIQKMHAGLRTWVET